MVTRKSFITLAGLTVVAVGLGAWATPVQAQWCYPYYTYAPSPVYVAPAPVYVAPAPYYYVPRPSYIVPSYSYGFVTYSSGYRHYYRPRCYSPRYYHRPVHCGRGFSFGFSYRH